MPLPTSPLVPFGAAPSARQLAWHALEFYGFLHFTVNTFTGREWGKGDESPAVFNPSDFSADQMVETAALGGMKGLILTAKHHDGFCLWPSDHTTHSVKNSPWRGGKGDVVAEIAASCQKYGLKFGVYLSPWDRNHPAYATPAYLVYYRDQLRELLTRYGPLFEIWFDGANGGDGYYGGKYERRSIDADVYYEWEQTFALVRELQPDACIFNPPGADIRWVGNERGIAGDPCWHTLDPVAGSAMAPPLLNKGVRGGSLWFPAECDVSIRPGWFYHTKEDWLVRTPRNLFNLYLQSVGRGANLLLNLPPTPAGRIHPRDRDNLIRFHQYKNAVFAADLARRAAVQASSTRDDSSQFAPANLLDDSPETFWAAGDDGTTADIVLDFDQPVSFDLVEIREAVHLGQRIEGFSLELWDGSGWQEIHSAAMIGFCRLAQVPTQTTQRLRLRITASAAPPVLSKIGLYASGPLPPATILDWFYDHVYTRIR